MIFPRNRGGFFMGKNEAARRNGAGASQRNALLTEFWLACETRIFVRYATEKRQNSTMSVANTNIGS